MKAIILPEYNANVIRAMKSLQVYDLNIPKPNGGQVLIKVAAAPCNPSDIAFMRGGYWLPVSRGCSHWKKSNRPWNNIFAICQQERSFSSPEKINTLPVQ